MISSNSKVVVTMLILLLLASLIGSCYSGCTNLITKGLNQKDIDYLLGEHNRIRAKVAAGEVDNQPAGDIPPLTWSSELSERASLETNKCSMQHTDPQSGECLGENIYYCKDTIPEKKGDKAVEKWYNEHINFDFSKKNYDKNVLHYTQLVWGKTTEVGCGYVAYNKIGNTAEQILFCIYKPCGNFGKEKPYKKKGEVDTKSVKIKASVKARTSVNSTSSVIAKTSLKSPDNKKKGNEPKKNAPVKATPAPKLPDTTDTSSASSNTNDDDDDDGDDKNSESKPNKIANPSSKKSSNYNNGDIEDDDDVSQQLKNYILNNMKNLPNPTNIRTSNEEELSRMINFNADDYFNDNDNEKMYRRSSTQPIRDNRRTKNNKVPDIGGTRSKRRSKNSNMGNNNNPGVNANFKSRRSKS